MANPDSVGQNTQDSFGNYKIAFAGPVALNATANAVAALPILRGGMQGTGSFIVRRITVANLSNIAGGAAPNAATVQISVGATNDGANLFANAQALTNLTGATGYADLTLSATANTSTSNANAFFVNVTANVANAQAFIAVYGDVVSF